MAVVVTLVSFGFIFLVPRVEEQVVEEPLPLLVAPVVVGEWWLLLLLFPPLGIFNREKIR